MLLNEQKKQSIERYNNQNHTQQQIANALDKRIPKSQEMETMRKHTTSIAINPHPENDDSDIPSTATTGKKSAIPATTHNPVLIHHII